MKVVVIIQARMESTRLPGKVLMDVAGRPMLAQQVRRLKQCHLADEIIVATTTEEADDPIAKLAGQEGVGYFRGSSEDVLHRFVEAARHTHADVVVRVTADCPLIDPTITDKVIHELCEYSHLCDYASNVTRRTYPRGLDTEAFHWDTLLRIERMAQSQIAREHVTIVPRSERPDLFLCRLVEDEQDNSDLRWTVDTENDLRLVRHLYENLAMGERSVTYSEVLSYARSHPELSQINQNIETWNPAPMHGRQN
jgi:spore coat polysaccharide biosynthesis protein SpsF